MKIFKVTLVICLLINASLAFQHVNPEDRRITYEWQDDVSRELNTNFLVLQQSDHALFSDQDHHSLALLKCDFTSGYPDNCNVTIQAHHFDNTIRKTICLLDLSLKVRMNMKSFGRITFLKKNSILITYVMDGAGGRSGGLLYQLISTETCEGNNNAYFLPEVPTVNFPLLQYNDHFEFVLKDEQHCHSRNHYCTISHSNDIKGFLREKGQDHTKTNLGAKFDELIIENIYVMKGIHKEAPVVIGRKKEHTSTEKERIYSPVKGWMDIQSAILKEHSFSNSSGYATFCWSSKNKQIEMSCKWLDDTRNYDETMQLKFAKHFNRLPYIYNQPDGNILMVRAAVNDQKSSKVVIDQGYMNGLCKRIVEVEVPHVPSEFLLSIVKGNTYCISYIGKTIQDPKKKIKSYVRNTFTTRCVEGQDDETQEFFNCGNQKYFA